MTEQESWLLIGRLAVETQGWDETNLAATRTRIEALNDFAAAERAVERVIESWGEPGRPRWSVIKEAYKVEVRRAAMERPAISTPAHVVSFSEGRQIAARKYAEHCRTRNPETDVHILSGFRTNEPNPVVLDAFLGIRPDD